jgi:rhodanese-related sulfurtransferase
MRDHIRKFGRRGGAGWVGFTLWVAVMLGVVQAAAQPETATPTDPRGRIIPPAPRASCPVSVATLGEAGQPTREISTDEMERILADRSALVFDSRPHEEFSISHIPGALNVAPKPGLPMSQYTGDVGEIEKITKGDKARAIVLYCNGPFCGKSKRLAADLLAAGYTNVVRYQLGIPVWRALGHPAQAEGEAIWSALDKDKTAVVIDAREPEAFHAKSLPGARNVRASEVAKAKDDGRLPMLDHNTRIFVIGKDEAEARAAAQEIAKNAFHNVAFFAGSLDDLMRARPRSGVPGSR